MKKNLTVFIFFTLISVLTAQNLTGKQKSGVYVSEKCIQEFNLKHSYRNLTKVYKNYSFPSFFVYSDSAGSYVRNSMLYGEGISENIKNYQFYKYNNSIYMIDVDGNYYFKISDYIPDNYSPYSQEVDIYTKYFSQLLKNFISDSKLQKYITDENIDDLIINSMYEEDYYIYNEEYKADFVLGRTNYEILDDEIVIAQGKINDHYKQIVYEYDHEIARVKIQYDNFERNLNIILRNNDIVVPEELNTLNKDELRILRNAVYAKYGRPFVSEDLQVFFGSKSWYKINNNFSETSFTIFDKRNIENIQAAEALLNSQ